MVEIAEVDKTIYVDYDSLTIRDVLNQPKTCTFTTLKGYQPPALASVVVLRGTIVLFAGNITSIKQTFDKSLSNIVWEVSAINHNYLLRRRCPLEFYNAVSATTVVQDLITTFSSGFTSVGVEAALPAVTISFDGSQDLASCLSAIATLIGGYWYVDEWRDVHFFLTEASDSPDALDDSNTSALFDPPVTANVDYAQIRTRVNVMGGGAKALVPRAAADTTIPVEDATYYGAGGGSVKTGAQVLTYTGKDAGGAATTVVGNVAAPGSAPTAALGSGAGRVTAGAHYWKTAFGNSSGETAPGPASGLVTSVDFATLGAPSGSYSPGAMLVGGYKYAVTAVTALGETTLGTVFDAGTAAVWTNGNTFIPANLTPQAGGGLVNGGSYYWKLTAVVRRDGLVYESDLSNASGNVVPAAPNLSEYLAYNSAPSWATHWRIYRTVNGGSSYRFVTELPIATGNYTDGMADSDLGGIGPSISAIGQLANLTSIPTGVTGTLARRIYRTKAGGSTYFLLTQIGDNATSTFTDNIPDTSLGGFAPVANTAGSSQVSLSSIPTGGAGVTLRVIYRTKAGGSDYYYAGTINDNATTTFTDNLKDSELGRLALASSSIGALAGDASVLVASTTGFPAAGWFRADSQIVSYTSTSGSTFTGIPASGVGAITGAIKGGLSIVALPFISGIPASGAGQILYSILAGDTISLFVQRNDVPDQNALAALEGGDGIHEGNLNNAALITIAQCNAAGDADLTLFSTPIVTVSYATRDLKTRSGKSIVVNRTYPAIASTTLTIQDVTIARLELAAPGGPHFTTIASTVKYTLQDLLTRLVEGVGV